MRLKIGNKRLIVNFKRFFTSLVIVALIVVCITLPVDKYIIHNTKSDISKASASQTTKIQPLDHRKDVQTAKDKPGILEASTSHTANVQSPKDKPEIAIDRGSVSQTANDQPDNHSKDVQMPEDKLNISENGASQTVDAQPDQTEDVQAPNASDEVISDKDDKNNKDNPSIDNELESNKDYCDIFRNDVFIGDSITESLSFYEYIDDENTIAKLGLTLVKAQNEVDVIAGLKPQNVYIMFGANDIDGILTDEKYLHNYIFLISKIREKSPQSNIYVQSILPVSEEVGQKEPYLNQSHISKLNSDLHDIAEKEGVKYINVASLLENMGQDIYEPDGIHLKSNFYPLWLDYLINVLTVLRDKD